MYGQLDRSRMIWQNLCSHFESRWLLWATYIDEVADEQVVFTVLISSACYVPSLLFTSFYPTILQNYRRLLTKAWFSE